MDKVLNMTYASSLTDLCEVNSSFDTGVLRVCYAGRNRNGSSISKEVLAAGIPTIYNCPIVCNYDRESDTLGGHDMEVVRDNDGGLRLVNMTQPVGVIPERARVWFEDYEEEDGTVHEYMYVDVLLWKRQEAYKKIKNDGITAHSMEITVKDGKTIDGVYVINDFEFTAFALIGCTPCYESSALKMFSQTDFKQQLSEMMQDLKETFTLVNTSANSEDDNKHPENSMKGGSRELDKLKELAAKYGVDIDTLNFSIEGLTDEELEAKFEAMSAPEPKEPEGGDDNGKFALTETIIQEMIASLEAEKIQCEWGEHPHYYYVDCDFDAKEVYCWDSCDWLLYGFTYEADGDKIIINFESKKRKKYVIADFDEGEQASPFAPVFTAMSQKIQDGAAIEEKYQKATESIASMETELTELRKFKADTEDAIETEKRNELFAQFEDLVGNEAFEALKENCSEFDLEALEEKCFAIRGRIGTTVKFNLDKKVPKQKVDRTETNNEPYGGIFVEYAKDGSN